MSREIAKVENENEEIKMSNYLQGNFDNINQGTIAVESSRAIAEAQGKLIIAKRFPRDEIKSYAKISEVCQRKGMAEKAFFNFPKGGKAISGPTIRFAEELARCWGNLDYGIKELSQSEGKSEMQAYCWDMETNTISTQTFTNPHAREQGGQVVTLTSLRDIYEVNANMAARRLRSRILAILPSNVVDDAIDQCKKTLAGKSDVPLVDRINKMVVEFKKFGVTQEQIEVKLGHKIENMTVDELVDFIGIFNGIKDGATKVADWFEMPKEANSLTSDLSDIEEIQ